MDTDELLKSFKEANAKADYQKILTIERFGTVPEKAEILAEVAVALKAVGRFSEADHYAQRSLALDPSESTAKAILAKFEQDEKRFAIWKKDFQNPRYYQAYLEHGESLIEQRDYEAALDVYQRAVAVGVKDVAAYHGMGNANIKLGRFREAMQWYNRGLAVREHESLLFGRAEAEANSGNLQEAIATLARSRKVNPRHEPSNVGMASYLIRAGELQRALKVLDETLLIDPGNGRAYFYKALTYQKQREFTQMLASAQEAVRIFDSFYQVEKSEFSILNLAASYSLLAAAQIEKRDVDAGIECYTKAIEINDLDYGHYYNRANAYIKKLRSLHSESDDDLLGLILADFEKAHLYSFGNNSYHAALSLKYKGDYYNYIRNNNLFRIALVVSHIKEMLKYEEKQICHFTSLSTARELLLNGSAFRLSEGSFLNDPSEGAVLQRFLGEVLPLGEPGRTIDRRFSPKVFIGSFVHESGKNDLTLWRMYGKEQMKEAAGCSLTLQTEKLTDYFRSSALQRDHAHGLAEPFGIKNMDEEFGFYWVAYTNFENESKFFAPGAGEGNNIFLNANMEMLRVLVEHFKSEHGDDEREMELLNEELNAIKYLFKTADYQNEREVRIVLKAGNLEKQVDHQANRTPRVYVSTFAVGEALEKITLGPKVGDSEEWASAFHYGLEKKGLFPEILISSLPFR